MSKVRLNPILEQLRGQVGDLVFRKYGEGVVVISRKPDVAGVESTEAQRAQRERFREGVLYGKMVVADPSTEFILRELEGLRAGPAGRERPGRRRRCGWIDWGEVARRARVASPATGCTIARYDVTLGPVGGVRRWERQKE